MNRYSLLGTASALMFVLALAAPEIGLPQVPWSIAFAFTSFLLGIWAAKEGGRWWLLVPGMVAALSGLVIFILFVAGTR